MVPIHQQLPHIALRLRRHPDPRKPSLQHQLEDQFRVPPVRLLRPLHGRPDARRIAHPQLMPAFLQQPPEPLARHARFHAHSHFALQPTTKLRRRGRMQQLLLSDLSRLIVKDRNLLKPRMEITAYNPHGWLFPGSSAFFAKTDYPLRGQPRYEIKWRASPPWRIRAEWKDP